MSRSKVIFALICFYPVAALLVIWFPLANYLLTQEEPWMLMGLGTAIQVFFLVLFFSVIPSVAISFIALARMMVASRKGEPIYFFLFCTLAAGIPAALASYEFLKDNLGIYS